MCPFKLSTHQVTHHQLSRTEDPSSQHICIIFDHVPCWHAPCMSMWAVHLSHRLWPNVCMLHYMFYFSDYVSYGVAKVGAAVDPGMGSWIVEGSSGPWGKTLRQAGRGGTRKKTSKIK